MKIAFVNSLYTPNEVGGAEAFVRNLAESLVDRDIETMVLSTHRSRTPEQANINGVRSHYIGLSNLYWPYGDEEAPRHLKPLWHSLDSFNPLMARKAGDILRMEAPDVVHTNNLSGLSVSCWLACRKMRVPILHTMHDHYLLCPRATMYRNETNCQSRCGTCLPYSLPRQASSNSVDAVVGVSKYILQRHLDNGYFSRSPIREVIPNPYDPQEQPDVSSKPTAGGDLRLGYFGQLTPAKGIEELLKATEHLPDEGWELLVGGRGKPAYQDRLHARFASRRVRFIGYSKPEEFFRKIDLLVIPSLLNESFGRGVIEANGYGVPVLAADRGGLSELVSEGVNGWFFDPGYAAGFREILSWAINNPGYIRSRTSDCKEHSGRYTSARVTDSYERIYRRLLSRRNGTHDSRRTEVPGKGRVR